MHQARVNKIGKIEEIVDQTKTKEKAEYTLSLPSMRFAEEHLHAPPKVRQIGNQHWEKRPEPIETTNFYPAFQGELEGFQPDLPTQGKSEKDWRN